LRTELQPVKKHVALVDAGLKLVGALASAAAFVLGVVKILFG
jgi:hypothetical protein